MKLTKKSLMTSLTLASSILAVVSATSVSAIAGGPVSNTETTTETSSSTSATSTNIYRTYNPNSGEHLYTGTEKEAKDLVAIHKWTDEGIGWVAPTSGETVYRLYNPNNGEHFYTKSEEEANGLAKLGWRKEGKAFYSGNSSTGSAVYRLYNPNGKGTDSHHYTLSTSERDWLVSLGWKAEGTAFYTAEKSLQPEQVVSSTTASNQAQTTTAATTNPITTNQQISLGNIKSGNYSDIAGTWTNAKGNTITIDGSGSAGTLGTINLSSLQISQGFLSGLVTKDVYGATFIVVPSGVEFPAEFYNNNNGSTDTSRDRIFIGQFKPTANDVYYRSN